MSTTIQVDSQIKEKVTPILAAFGLSVDEATNVFLHMVLLNKAMPFSLSLYEPSPEFWEDVAKAHEEYENGTAEVYKTTEEFMASLMEGVDD